LIILAVGNIPAQAASPAATYCTTTYNGTYSASTKECTTSDPAHLNGCAAQAVYAIIKTGPHTYTGVFAYCVAGGGPSISKNVTAFTDSTRGMIGLPPGASGDFTYAAGTCTGRCRITTSLTPDAKAALGELPGTLEGKLYVTIKDTGGDPTIGSFKICFKAKGVKTPQIYKFNGGSWMYLGGFWDGAKFCTYAETSGNYVLINYKP
jgi:hypothetical protein